MKGEKIWCKFILIALIISTTNCETEKCQISFKTDFRLYEESINVIYDLDLEMDSKETYFRHVKTINKKSGILRKSIFEEVQYVECHKDSTIIFQAYNCQKEYLLRDVVYFLAYSPKGLLHVKGKRNSMNLREIENNWFYGKHINTVAD